MAWLWKNRKSYDLLHLHGYCWAAISSLLVSKVFGKKTIYKITLPGEDDPWAIYNSRFGRIKNIFLQKYDALIAISERTRKPVLDFGCSPEKIFSIPNGVEDTFYPDNKVAKEARRVLAHEYQLDPDCRIILYIGSIEHRKGVDLLVEAWPRIISEVPMSRLFLVGPYFRDTEFHRHLVESVKPFLGKSIYMTGSVENPGRYFQASDIFVFPSRNESFGNVLAEAMACGRACIATRIEGVTENILLNGYNGITVDREDAKALADAILVLLQNPGLKDYLAANAAKTVDEKFRIDGIAERYEELYKLLLTGK
jgi:glycosyltransferase involved in cell wall biosynthesis